MRTLTGVGAYFSAAHRDKLTGDLHGHSYEVIAWHECEHGNDAENLREHLRKLCEGLFDHKELPPELAWGEDIARAILHLSLPSCVAVEVRRPIERFYARAEV